jgi:coniferyl-aldehyde dehydrogenase
MHSLFDRQRAAFALDMMPSHGARIDRLDRLQAMTERIAPQLAEAISADFGHRPAQLTEVAEVMTVLAGIRHTRRHLRHWMRSRRVPTSLAYQPASCRITPQPLGVVGVVSPWNYPYQMAIAPAVAAIAAGNRVMIKPSELTPRTSQLIHDAVAQSFDAEELGVVLGDEDVGRSFVSLPFDHLLFTGSTQVGRQVAMAAAANLTPVTLELGGKSPAILGADFDAARAADALVATKLFNAGQTCMAPDYVIVPRLRIDEFVAAVQTSARRMYPDALNNPDYTSIISERHLARLQGLLDDARSQGATVVTLSAGEGGRLPRMLPPALVLGVDEGMQIMQQEIFGPLLPVMVYDDLDEALAHVNAQPRPLALYWFGRDADTRERVLRQTISGGVTVNDCLMHFTQEDLPFGGVGASGMGAYHGEVGFKTFSKDKPVFIQSRWSGVPLMHPPYGRVFRMMAKLLRRIG